MQTMRFPSLVSHLALWIAAALAAAGCARQDATDGTAGPGPRNGPLKVYTVNYPLEYFALRIGGDQVEALFPAPADEDPAYWTPDAETIEEYQQADLILLNGAGYAKWRDKVTLPETKLRDTSASFRDRYIKIDDAVTHTHGPEGEHTHAGTAFTTWLDPQLASLQAHAVHDALAEALPEHASLLEQNQRDLQTELSNLDRELEELVGRKPDTLLLFSHPVYQYLERRYQLQGRSVHWEPDSAPTEKMWSELDALLKEHPANWMIWEGEPLEETRALLAERGVQSVVFAPCGNRPESGDFLTVMRQNVDNLRPVFD